MSDEDYAVLQSSLSPVVNPDSEQVKPTHTLTHSSTHSLTLSLAHSLSLVPRLFPPPVFDRLQYANTEGEGLGDLTHSLTHPALSLTH